MTAASWTKDFLAKRELSEPDGRALYAYRCTVEEFDRLREVLRGPHHSLGSINGHYFRAFVLYAAQWWQRQYDGRRWAWEPLLDSIDWAVHYPDLYPGVRRAWRWWKVKPVRLPSSTRFLGTFACHGGLPLALVGDAGAPITRYLRAVLHHTLEYRRFVEDTIELAKDKEDLLRPPTLRRDYVFRLVADVVEAVLDLQPDAQGDDPIASLDCNRAEWRKGMPLDLGNEQARALLIGLLRDAAQGSEMRGEDFRVQRFLRLTSVGWRLGARVRPPASISGTGLARQLSVTDDLPPRIEVRMLARGTHVVGVYDQGGESGEEYRLASRQARLELWDEDAAAEMRLQFLAGDYIGDGIVPLGGASLGELPWAFRADEHECPLIGEGTVRNRSPEIVVLAPRGDGRSVEGAEEEGEVLGRALWRVRSTVTIQTEFGVCTVRPGVAEQPAEDYRLWGMRWYDADCVHPLYRGVPKLTVGEVGGSLKNVPEREVEWRRTGGGWQQAPAPVHGLWQVRHVVQGELRFYSRVGILPVDIAMKLELGGTVSEGVLAFSGTGRVRVATDDADLDVHEEGDSLRVALKAADALQPPTTVNLRLDWQGASELHVVVPFPGLGGRFLREGKPVHGLVAADELYGVRAIALSPISTDRFWVEGELRALDLGSLIKVAHFRRLLRRTGSVHELSLIDVRTLIESLLSASSSSDAYVALRIVNGAGESQCDLKVAQFATEIAYVAANAYVELSSPPAERGALSFQAIPMARPDDDPLTLATDGHIAALPPDFHYEEPWLAVARHDGRICARPKEVSRPPRAGMREISDSPLPRLAEAARVTDPERRRVIVASALQRMAEDDAGDVEQEWEFLTNTILSTDDLPASAVDVLVGLTKAPRLLVRSLFRMDSMPRQRLWRLEEQLPFSWLLVKRSIWWKETAAAVEAVLSSLGDVEKDAVREVAIDHIGLVLAEGVANNAGLSTVATDISGRLRGEQMSQEYAEEKRQAIKMAMSNQIILRTDLDDWPQGDGRMEWIEEIGHPKVLGPMWLDPDELRYRQPLFDTPVAAAFYAVGHVGPSRRAIYLVRRMRMHDPKWFDLVYGAAWATLATLQGW